MQTVICSNVVCRQCGSWTQTAVRIKTQRQRLRNAHELEVPGTEQKHTLIALSTLPGLRGTEMWGGGFSARYELLGQISISWGHQENKTTAARSHMHVSSIKNEGDCALNGGETLYLHGQLGPARGTAGNWLLHTWMLHNTYSTICTEQYT